MNQDVTKNNRAMNMLYCGLHPGEFERIFLCTSDKEIWDKLVITYEGISK